MKNRLWLLPIVFLVPFSAGALTLTTEEYPPLNFSTDGGKTITGSSTDIMREVLKRTNIQGTIALYPWVRALKMAGDDKDTCVFSAARTPAREKQFKWVGPLTPDSWILYAKADSPITLANLDEAKKFKIGGYQGDGKAAFLKEKGFPIDEASNEEQTIRKLEAGRIDLWAGSSLVAPWMAKNMNIKIKPVISFNEVQMYTACNPSVSDADITKMNDAIKSMKGDGTIDKFIGKYR